MVITNNQKPALVAKKLSITRTFHCPNPYFQKGFDIAKQSILHIGLSKCHQAVLLIVHSKQVQEMLEDQQAGPRTTASVIDLFAAEEQYEPEEVIPIDDNTGNSTIGGSD